MDDSLVYRKTRLGAAELSATHGALAPHSRPVLILLDGRRTVAELAELFGAETVERVLPELEEQGLARLVDPERVTEGQGELTELTTDLSGGLPSEEFSPDRPAGPLRWIALVAAALAIGGGYWVFARPDRAGSLTPSDQAVAVANPIGVDRIPASAVPEDTSKLIDAEPVQTARELPLSGLPAVTISKAAASAVVAVAGPVPPAVPGRRPVDRPASNAATAAPEAAQPVEAKPVPVAAKNEPAPAVAPDSPVPALPKASEPQADSAPQQGADRGPTSEAARSGAVAPTQIATVAPPPQPASEAVTLRPRRHDPPEFPGRAARARILEGRVLARIWVTAEGGVDQVDIVKATPAHVFDDEVRRALSLWTFDPPGHPVNTTVELNFKP